MPQLQGNKHKDKNQDIKEGEAERQEEAGFLMAWGAATSSPVLTICQLQVKFQKNKTKYMKDS